MAAYTGVTEGEGEEMARVGIRTTIRWPKSVGRGWLAGCSKWDNRPSREREREARTRTHAACDGARWWRCRWPCVARELVRLPLAAVLKGVDGGGGGVSGLQSLSVELPSSQLSERQQKHCPNWSCPVKAERLQLTATSPHPNSQGSTGRRRQPTKNHVPIASTKLVRTTHDRHLPCRDEGS
jgi:hypothetical protein